MNSMMISAISDVHVKFPGDEADQLLQRFLKHPEVQRSDYVLLLGDIFDLMSGQHPEYIRDFGHLFGPMNDLLKSGKRVYFFEGNHDVHLRRLFRLFWKKGELIPLQSPVILKIDGKSFYFSHGDEHEVDNLSYQRYKKFISSRPIEFASDYLMPYALLNFIGQRASQRSRKVGSRTFNEELVRERFRKGVQETTHGQYDFVLGGHSHVKDTFRFGRTTYVNNGYAQRSKTFILIKDGEVSFPSL